MGEHVLECAKKDKGVQESQRGHAERVVAQMKLKPTVVTPPPPRPWWEELFRKEVPPEAPVSTEDASKAAARNSADALRAGLVVIPIKATKMVRVAYASANPRLVVRHRCRPIFVPTTASSSATYRRTRHRPLGW